MRTIDLWKRERDAAQVLPCGLKVLKQNAGQPVVLIWRPKATNPYAHYRFRTPAKRQDYIRKEIKLFTAAERKKKQAKKNRRGTAADLEKITAGAIFSSSWGYDQTNVDFYQVVERHGRKVLIREIAQESVLGSKGFMSDTRMPQKDAFLENKRPLRKLLQFYDGRPYIVIESFAHAYLWDGRPRYHSWYA